MGTVAGKVIATSEQMSQEKRIVFVFGNITLANFVGFFSFLNNGLPDSGFAFANTLPVLLTLLYTALFFSQSTRRGAALRLRKLVNDLAAFWRKGNIQSAQ